MGIASIVSAEDVNLKEQPSFIVKTIKWTNNPHGEPWDTPPFFIYRQPNSKYHELEFTGRRPDVSVARSVFGTISTSCYVLDFAKKQLITLGEILKIPHKKDKPLLSFCVVFDESADPEERLRSYAESVQFCTEISKSRTVLIFLTPNNEDLPRVLSLGFQNLGVYSDFCRIEKVLLQFPLIA